MLTPRNAASPPYSYTLLNEASATSATYERIRGGAYLWTVEGGTWGGATATLQQLKLDGTTWATILTVNGGDAALTEDGELRVALKQGVTIRVLISGGPPSGINSTLAGGANAPPTVMDAGVNHIGSVSPEYDIITLSPTLDTSAYADGDVLFDVTLTSNMMRKNDKPAKLMSIVGIDENVQAPSLDLLFFDAAVTLGTANAAPTMSDADSRNLVGLVKIVAADWRDVGAGQKVASLNNINMIVRPVSGARTLYIGAIARSIATFTSAGMRFRFGFEQG